MRGLALGDTVAVLLKSLKHSDPEVRRSAAAALETFGAEAKCAVPILQQSLNDPDLTIQVTAARTLGRIGVAAIPALLQGLNHTARQVRREATWALTRLGPAAEAAVPALASALRDSDLKVCMGAAQALGAIGAEAETAIPALIEALLNANLIFCRLAAQALARIGRAAIPALQEASQSPDTFVRREAFWALKQLGQPTPNLAFENSSSDSSSVLWARKTGGRRRGLSPQVTEQIPLHPKRIRQTIKIPLA
jgi:HEAT repeat protein